MARQGDFVESGVLTVAMIDEWIDRLVLHPVSNKVHQGKSLRQLMAAREQLEDELVQKTRKHGFKVGRARTKATDE